MNIVSHRIPYGCFHSLYESDKLKVFENELMMCLVMKSLILMILICFVF